MTHDLHLPVWLNGELIDSREAAVSLNDHGFTLGDGAFETMLASEQGVFALTRHLRRLESTCRRLALGPIDVEGLRAAVLEVVAAARAGHSEIGGLLRVRVTVSSGVGPAGLARGEGPVTVAITAVPQHVERTAVRAALVPWVRNERGALAGIKTICAGENVLAARFTQSIGADEGIWANTRGDLCEGTTTNVFVEYQGSLLTPALDSGCLPGIARELLVHWCRAAGLAISETRVPLAVLDAVRGGESALLVTSAVRGVVPVTSFDGCPVSSGTLSAQAVQIFEDRMVEEWEQ